MPLYRIHVTSSDRASDGIDREGIMLAGLGAAPSSAIERLLSPQAKAYTTGVCQAMSALNGVEPDPRLGAVGHGSSKS